MEVGCPRDGGKSACKGVGLVPVRLEGGLLSKGKRIIKNSWCLGKIIGTQGRRV